MMMMIMMMNLWIRETGTGQQVTQLHDSYMMMMMMLCLTLYLYTLTVFVTSCSTTGMGHVKDKGRIRYGAKSIGFFAPRFHLRTQILPFSETLRPFRNTRR